MRPYTGEFLTAVSGSMPLLLPSPCVTGSALSCSLAGQHVGAASFTLWYGRCFASLSWGVTTLQHNQSPSCIAEGPARFAWQPDLYQSWTSLAPHCVWCSAGVTSKQTMIYQDTPCFVGQFLFCMVLRYFHVS